MSLIRKEKVMRRNFAPLHDVVLIAAMIPGEATERGDLSCSFPVKSAAIGRQGVRWGRLHFLYVPPPSPTQKKTDEAVITSLKHLEKFEDGAAFNGWIK